jgi:hypothetical protein
MCRDSLEEGYRTSHEQLFPGKPKASYVSQKTTDLIVAPYLGNPILGTDYHHLEADDAYVPILRELEYVLCENKLTSADSNHSKLLPVMPRYRSIGKSDDGDMYWDKGVYHWNSKRRHLSLSSAASSLEIPAKDENTWILRKTRGDVLDHLVTKRSGIHTDLFIYPPADQQDDIIICGITRETTSTKEYATVEAEAYAGSILEALKQRAEENENINIVETASARLFYPRNSFFDIELLKWAETSAVLPSDRAGFPRRDLSFLRRSLDAMPMKSLIPSAVANIRKKFMVLVGEYVIATVLSVINLYPNTASAVRKFLEAIFK